MRAIALALLASLTAGCAGHPAATASAPSATQPTSATKPGTEPARSSSPRVTDVAFGARHACALDGAGAVSCWGDDDAGQLGDGASAARTRPAPVQGIARAKGVASGDAFSCALEETGAVQCWGDGVKGQLGDGAQRGRATPAAVSELDGVVQIAARGAHACALKNDGTVLCWGETERDVVRKTPAPVFGLGKVSAIAVGALHGCAMVDKGVRCWGTNSLRQLGAKGAAKGLPAIPEVEGEIAELALGDEHSCARTKAGEMWCWGGGLRCIPGEPQPGRIVAVKPAKIPLPSPAAHVATSGDRACARLESGAVVCVAPHGEHKQCAADERLAESATLGPFVGPAQTCLVGGDGALRCLGKNTAGELGDGTRTDRAALTPVAW